MAGAVGGESVKQMDADCIIRHMNAFLSGKEFGEPCEDCEYFLNECNAERLSRLEEVCNDAKVPVQLTESPHNAMYGKEELTDRLCGRLAEKLEQSFSNFLP